MAILSVSGQNVEEKNKIFTELDSAHTEMEESYPLFFMFFQKKMKKKLKKKIFFRKFGFFDSGTLIQIGSAGILS